jgi:hypothetical protein
MLVGLLVIVTLQNMASGQARARVCRVDVPFCRHSVRDWRVAALPSHTKTGDRCEAAARKRGVMPGIVAG